MSASSLRQRPPSPLELTLWLLLLLGIFLLAPAVAPLSVGDGWRLPLLPALASLPQRLISLLGMLLLGGGGILLGERYLLLEKGERATMLLFLLAFAMTTPSLALFVGLALGIGWLLLLYQLGTYQDTHQHRTYLALGILTGGLALIQLHYLLLLPILLWAGYYLRSLSLRALIALLMGMVLPLWIGGAILGLLGSTTLDAAQEWILLGIPLPDPRSGAGFTTLGLPSYLLFIGLYLLALLLYHQRYYRESVRHRDMTSALQRYPLLILLALPFLGREGAVLLPLLFLPLSMLLARGFSALTPRLAPFGRALILSLCIGCYLYRLGILEAVWRFLF